MGVKDAVVERFLNLCKEQNIKLNELANRSGVTPSTVYSLMDSSRRDVSIITIKKLCDGLDISLGEFFQSSLFVFFFDFFFFFFSLKFLGVLLLHAP